MSRVGLVLGGGGITGASFHFGTLLALRMATGWDPGTADVVVGTSSGAAVAAITRSGRLDLEALVGNVDGDAEFAAALGERIYRRIPVRGVGRWVRYGLLHVHLTSNRVCPSETSLVSIPTSRHCLEP